jgi:hypothetical protein
VGRSPRTIAPRDQIVVVVGSAGCASPNRLSADPADKVVAVRSRAIVPGSGLRQVFAAPRSLAKTPNDQGVCPGHLVSEGELDSGRLIVHGCPLATVDVDSSCSATVSASSSCRLVMSDTRWLRPVRGQTADKSRTSDTTADHPHHGRLDRLSGSPHAGRFVLNGGAIGVQWSYERRASRNALQEAMWSVTSCDSRARCQFRSAGDRLLAPRHPSGVARTRPSTVG